MGKKLSRLRDFNADTDLNFTRSYDEFSQTSKISSDHVEFPTNSSLGPMSLVDTDKNFRETHSSLISDENEYGKLLGLSLKLNGDIAKSWRPDEELKTNDTSFRIFENSPYMLPFDTEVRAWMDIHRQRNNPTFGRLSHVPSKQMLSRPGSRALDVGLGSGPGILASEIAKKYPQAEIHEFYMSQMESEQYEKLPNNKDPDNYFDVVYQSNIILAVPREKWLFEINELVRILKPGGYLEVIEVDPKFKDGGPICEMFFTGLGLACEARGLDMGIAKKMPKIFKNCGLLVQSESIHSIKIGWGGPIEFLETKAYHRGISILAQKLILPENNIKISSTSTNKEKYIGKLLPLNSDLEYKRLHLSDKCSPFQLPEGIEVENSWEIRHQVYTHIFGSLYHAPITDILTQKKLRILDVGCGTGSWIRDMAIKYPEADFYGF
ncbi:hypothetical protein HK096_007894, partial [Nowakowskiella sp. JEL0078]